MTANNARGDAAVREWFSKIDRVGQGKFTIQNFADFLATQNIACSKEAVVALYARMDADGLGVQYSKFTAWIVQHGETQQVGVAEAAGYSSLTLWEVQRKSYRYLVAVAGSTANSLEQISESYSVYDWRRLGSVSKAAFMKATARAGFPFTANELALLSAEFGDGKGVAYKKFLSWAAPEANPTASQAVVPHGGKSVRNTANVVKFLERSFARGVDLLSVFGKYDPSGDGRVTASDFCAVFADLGLSTVSTVEALEAAAHFRAVVHDFVLYRHIVSELLRRADETTGAADVNIVDELRALLHKSRVSEGALRSMFEEYDRKRNGLVRSEDVGIVLESVGVRLRRLDLDMLLGKYSDSRAPDWMRYEPLLKAIFEKSAVAASTGRGFGKTAALPEELSVKFKNLLELLILKGVDYRHEFDRCDRDSSGTVSQSDFRRVIESFDRSFSVAEISAAERLYRSKVSSGRVDFVRLIHHLHPRNFGRVNLDSDGLLEKESWEIAENLRQKIRRHGHGEHSSREELQRNFRHFCRNKRDNRVDLDGFSVAVRDLGILMTPEQERAVFNMVNLNGGSSFRYDDFVVFVCDPQHVDIIWKLRRGIQRANISEKEIVSAMSSQDSSGLGLITAKQFLAAMKSCSVELSNADVLRLLLRFDGEKQTEVTAPPVLGAHNGEVLGRD